MEPSSPSWLGLAIGFFIGGFFVLIGAILIFVTIRAKRKIAESQKWPTALGTILSSEVRRSVSHDSDGDTTTSYQPVVKYTYSVFGTSYNSQRLTFGVQNSSHKYAQATVQRYPPNSHVPVHYNPNKPEEAVLEVQETSGNTCTLVAGIVFIAVGVIGGCVGLVITILNYVS